MSDQTTTIQINLLMETSEVKFGTSGARGLVSDMTDRVCYAYTMGFLQYLERLGELSPGNHIGIAYDFRPSSLRIMAACCQAIRDCGYLPINAGPIPTPAIALYGIQNSIPTLMVTGSHIPDDRNGIKFYRPGGEILKNDEQAIREESVTLPSGIFDELGMLRKDIDAPIINEEANKEYIERYTAFLPSDALKGKRIAVYQHSSVASHCLLDILARLGAVVIPLGYSKAFIPVDTEAVREEDITLAKIWADQHHFDAIVATDGDGDRPLIGDENGTWLRGDIVGILCAHYLSADAVVTPISSNTAVEKSCLFQRVLRTRIGSPFVIETMQQAAVETGGTVVGYEANGGFLTQTVATISEHALSPLPTRDAILPIIAILHMAAQKPCKVSELINTLPARYTYSDRIKGVPTELSLEKLEQLKQTNAREFLNELAKKFKGDVGNIQDIDTADGLRMTLSNGHIIHLRPSGNAPELRCYTEADTDELAQRLNQACMNAMQEWQ